MPGHRPDSGRCRLGNRALRLKWAAAVLLAIALPAAAPAVAAAALEQAGDDEPVPVPRLLRQAVGGWEGAARSEDAERIAGLYAPDGWFKPPCARLRSGRPAIAAGWRKILSYSPAAISLRARSFDVARGRDMAVERGRAQFLQNVGGLSYGTNMDYLRIWRRTGTSWLIAADMFTPGGPCGEAE